MMNGIEGSRYERDPSYNPERIEAKGIEKEASHENEVDLRVESQIFRDNERVLNDEDEDSVDGLNSLGKKIVNLSMPEYKFTLGNQYKWDNAEPVSLAAVARQVDALIAGMFYGQSILLRAVQSGRRGVKRSELQKVILRHGYDMPNTDMTYDFHAAIYDPFTKDSSTLDMFEGFHKWKPKCDDIPQWPVDIIEVFDADSYEAISYDHPRHGGISRDRYKLKAGCVRTNALLAVILVN